MIEIDLNEDVAANESSLFNETEDDKSGIIYDMSDEDYANIGDPFKCYEDGSLEDAIWRCSDLKKIYKTNFYDFMISGREHISGEALTFGSALHAYVLEHHLFSEKYSIGEVIDGKDYITTAQYEKIEKMAEQIMKKYGEIIDNTKHREIVVQSKIGNVNCKVKIDIPYILEDGSYYIIDLKTCGTDLYDRKTLYAVHDYLYAMQMSFYQDVCENAGLKVVGTGLLFSSKSDFKCQLYKMPQLLIEHGREQYQKALNQIESALTNGNFTDSGFTETIPVPEWIKNV